MFLTSVSSNNHLKMRLRGLWTGSYCRCRGTVPLHAVKHLPEEWQGISSTQPSSHTLTLTTSPPQTLADTRWECRRTRPQLPQRVQECLHLVQWGTWCDLRKLFFHLSVIWFLPVLDATEKPQSPDPIRQAKCRNVCREEWYKIAADKHSLVHLKWCFKKGIRGFHKYTV